MAESSVSVAPGRPLRDSIASKVGSRTGLVILGVLVAGFYAESIATLARRWANEPDYSHGFLVPVFAAYLLWHRRRLMAFGEGGRWLGVLLLVASAGVRLASSYYGYLLADPFSLIPCVAGIMLLIGGWPALRWSWPAVAFLVFMIPLPGVLAEQLSSPLQRIATECGTYMLQTLGVPAAAIGNVIHLSQEPPIMVVEACSGLRMLICFMAITVGAAFILEWPLLERLLVILSGVPIAVIANVTRITSTGFVQDHLGPQVAERIFHDFAGWLMMPLACLLVAFELWLFARLFPEPLAGPLVAANVPVSRTGPQPPVSSAKHGSNGSSKSSGRRANGSRAR